jgi:ABC-type multidrug transport system permease subunit
VDQRADEPQVAAARPAKPQIRRGFGLLQWWTLTRRCLTIVVRDTWNSALLMVQAPIIAALIVLVFGREASGEASGENWPSVAKATSTSVFLLALSAIWFGCSNSARQIVAEWAIYRRERMVNLRIPSYVASKFSVMGLLCVVQCAVLLAITHWGSGLRGPWLAMYGLLVLSAMVGVGVGLTISALARSSEMAIASLPIVILPMVILGGVLSPVHKMPDLSQWLCQLMPSRWAFESLLLMEAQERPKFSPPPLPAAAETFSRAAAPAATRTAQPRDDMAEAFFPADSQRMGVASGVTSLAAMLVVLAATIWFALRLRDIH